MKYLYYGSFIGWIISVIILVTQVFITNTINYIAFITMWLFVFYINYLNKRYESNI